MKKLPVAVLSAAVLTAPTYTPAFAQEAQSPQPVTATTTFIRVRNIRADFMAYWLDPKNTPEPNEFKQSRLIMEKMSGSESKVPKPAEGAFKLPAGIISVTAVNPQNALVVAGTEAGIAELKTTVAFLDKPFRHLEIEPQLVEASAEDAKSFKIDLLGTPKAGDPVEPGTLSLGLVRGNLPSQLNTLQAAKQAKVVSAPRVTAINNLTVAVPFAGISPQLGFTSDIGAVALTPTINNDDTITLLINVPPSPLDKPNKENKGIVSVVNVRDGDTLALSNLPLDFVSAPAAGRQAAPTTPVRMLFITPRIIRRLGDETRTDKPTP